VKCTRSQKCANSRTRIQSAAAYPDAFLAGEIARRARPDYDVGAVGDQRDDGMPADETAAAEHQHALHPVLRYAVDDPHQRPVLRLSGGIETRILAPPSGDSPISSVPP